MTNQSITKNERAELAKATPQQVEQALAKGNLAELSTEGRVAYYNLVCQSMGLNPLTRPFEFITLNGKVVLYAKRDATDQLRKINGASITRLDKERVDDLLVVTATATDTHGRTDSATGVVSVNGLKGEALANAMMKAETKAKRRVTLSLCGLGMLDETEVESVHEEETHALAPIQQPSRASAPITPEVMPANGNGHVGDEQRKSFIKLALGSGWSQDQIKDLLSMHWGFKGTAEITTEKYDEICAAFRDGKMPVDLTKVDGEDDKSDWIPF